MGQIAAMYCVGSTRPSITRAPLTRVPLVPPRSFAETPRESKSGTGASNQGPAGNDPAHGQRSAGLCGTFLLAASPHLPDSSPPDTNGLRRRPREHVAPPGVDLCRLPLFVAAANMTKLRVLVVDDCPDTRTGLRHLLRRWGHEVDEAAAGPAALSLAASFRPDVVLLDVGLPGMDGREVARQLRAIPGLEKALLVAVTGFGEPDNVTDCLQAGCDTHLLKPYDPLALKQLLDLHHVQQTTT
jgi:CheY-like chemotaxis protein